MMRRLDREHLKETAIIGTAFGLIMASGFTIFILTMTGVHRSPLTPECKSYRALNYRGGIACK